MEKTYIVAAGYTTMPPGIYLLDGWRAWEAFCSQIARRIPVTVRDTKPTHWFTASWHKDEGIRLV